MATDQHRLRPRGRRHDCDIEVEINEEHTFVLSKKLLAVFSARISNLLTGSKAIRSDGGFRRHKISLENFPGGFKAFEMCGIFCYTGGRFPITHTNVAVLRTAAEELEMFDSHVPGNLVFKAEEFLADARSWTWPELLSALHGCESVLHQSEKMWVPQRIASAAASFILNSAIPSSDDSSESSSGDSGSCASWSSSSTSWWFSDIAGLSLYLVERVLGSLVQQNVDHRYVARFMLQYVRTTLTALGCNLISARSEQSLNPVARSQANLEFEKRAQRDILETIIGRLSQLDDGSVSPRSLFAMLRIAVALEASKQCRTRIEKMIGLQLHRVTLDHVLVSSASATRYSGPVYDVDLVLRLLWYFVKAHVADNMCSLGQVALSTVGRLVDRYLAEISPDPHLHPHKFIRLAKSLPSCARITDDDLYRAVDLYLEAHPLIRKSEMESLCETVTYQRLSMEACAHIAQNPRFPGPLAVRALMAQRELLARKKKARSGAPSGGSSHSNRNNGSNSRGGECWKAAPPAAEAGAEEDEEEGEECSSGTVVTHHVKEEVIDPGTYRRALAQNEELRVGLSQMQAKVTSLERMCKSMRSEVVDTVRVKRLIC